MTREELKRAVHEGKSVYMICAESTDEDGGTHYTIRGNGKGIIVGTMGLVRAVGKAIKEKGSGFDLMLFYLGILHVMRDMMRDQFDGDETSDSDINKKFAGITPSAMPDQERFDKMLDKMFGK